MKAKKIFTSILAMLTLTSAVPLLGVQAKETNLVSGLPYTVKTGVGIEHSYLLQGTESDPAAGLLTDGKRASDNSYSDPGWHKFYRGLSRTVEFEVPETKAVTGFSVSMIQCNEAGVMVAPFVGSVSLALIWRMDKWNRWSAAVKIMTVHDRVILNGYRPCTRNA